MPNVNDMFPSKWLRAADLKGREHRLKIDRIVEETVADEDRYVVYFDRGHKGLVLNKTNADALAADFGPQTEGWLGQEVVLFSMTVSFKGQPTPAIRVRPIKPQPALHDEMNDEIPF